MQHFPEIQLTFAETRVLGSLLEKEVLTPDSYPLSLNSLVNACNQTSSRDPITSLGVESPHGALVRRIPVGEGRRVESFEHLLSEKAAPPGAVVERVIGGDSDTPRPSGSDEPTWKSQMENRLAALEEELADLRARLGDG